MNSEIEQGSYRGLDSLILVNDRLRAEFLPGYGSKLASLRDRSRDREFLFQPPPDAELCCPGYGADFAAFDASGFDEMFPTIDASFYPAGSRAGGELPDHGELWSLPWKAERSEEAGEEYLQFQVESRLLPCRLEKRVSMQDGQLQLEYTLHNGGQEEVEFIWAAHPLFQADPEMKIVLPREVKSVINVEDSNPHLGSWGRRHSYPFTESQLTGEEIDLSRVPGPERESCRKFYVAEPLERGYCALDYPSSDLRLELTFPAEEVPYLAVWKSLGGFRGDYNLALEPCTGAFDDLYLAHKTNRSAVVEAESTYEWWLNFNLAELE